MLAGKGAEKRPLELHSTDIQNKLISPLKYNVGRVAQSV
jgi:hypothetical protein